ncbi:hypothetical protein CPB84DRAFT_1813942 [Gymnopilus junonius]|uniref:HNH nuclease domain-containing protein n=1 Tax=Gymnopilus junonius TaxID=109634 RepID=A0A9P5NVV8_GYMJU|nr:hypothetical protein CPB84DRAFT_1813942 [Gymnopilus junonius]
MTSLPPQVPYRIRDIANVVSAYNICLTLEKALQRAIDKGEDVGRKMIYIRILGYLVHYVSTDRGLKTVIEEISSSISDTALLEIGKMYFDHYIRAFRANKGPIPTPSNHASRPSFDTISDMINDTLIEAPQSHADAKKLVALIRDGYRCVVTGKYDANSVTIVRELRERITQDSSLRREATECAHIFAESTNSSIEPGTPKRDYASSMWAVMRRFGYEELPDDLNGSKVHRLENVMTVVHGFHMDFDTLKVWFLATTEKEKYKLEAADSYVLRDYPEYVTFSTPDPVNLPVPSPAYLAIHAACAKVAHLSGAPNMDDSTTLDPNGASAETLEHALFELVASA